jgi:hypothetical protein
MSSWAAPGVRPRSEAVRLERLTERAGVLTGSVRGMLRGARVPGRAER